MKAVFALALLALMRFAAADVVPGVIVVQSLDKGEIVEVAKKLYSKTNPKNPKLNVEFDAKKFEDGLVAVPLVDIASQEIDEEGRLTPIGWTMADPIFRTAVQEKLIGNPSESPNVDEVRATMGKLKVGYILFVSAFADGDQVWTRAKLFKGSKEIWSEDVKTWQSTIRSALDLENAKHSIARTWVELMAGGPLKDLPRRKRAATPEATPGPGPATTGPSTIAPAPASAPPDNKQLLIDAMKLLSTKQYAEAVNLLRDAVDASPYDAERRQALISALIQTGEPELAAREARRAANLMPEKVEFWVSAARAWLAAGKNAEAIQDLNEAVARDPDGPATRLLLGETELAEGRYSLTSEHLSKVIEKNPSAYAFRLRACSAASQGLADGMRADLEAAQRAESKETAEELSRRHKMALKAGLAVSDGVAGEIRSLIQRARIGSDGLRATHDAAQAKTKCLSDYFSQVPVPDGHKNSTNRLLLALNLLAQGLADLQGSLQKPDEDALTEATINLGEAIKAIQAARDDLKNENG